MSLVNAGEEASAYTTMPTGLTLTLTKQALSFWTWRHLSLTLVLTLTRSNNVKREATD